MSLLLETTLGDLVIDLDIEGSPDLCRNILKLAKARYYTSTLIYHVQLHRFCQLGDPRGDGSGGACFQSLLLEATQHQQDGDKLPLIEDLTMESSTRRFMQSKGRYLTQSECQEKGRVVATELSGIPNTIGSQFLITIDEGPERALDGYFYPTSHASTTATAAAATTTPEDRQPRFLSLGRVVEDDKNVLDQIHAAYCDTDGRPYADIRIHRALVIHDPFEDPVGMDVLLRRRGVIVVERKDDGGGEDAVTMSPMYERPSEERVPHRILASELLVSTGDDKDIDDDVGEDPALIRAREEEIAKHEATSRAVVLEVLGDLPSADIQAPENVLFVCKLNPVTEDEDLELIFSRFDPNVKADIIRDTITGDSLQYAFVEFSTPQQCAQAYFKMNNALVDDRRIKVDFSQSVSYIWDKYNQRMRAPKSNARKSMAPATSKPSASQHQQQQRQPPPQRQNQRDKSRQQQQQQQQHGPSRQQQRGQHNGGRGPPPGRHGQNQNDARRSPSPPRPRQDDPPSRQHGFDEFGRRLDWDNGPRRDQPPPPWSRDGPRDMRREDGARGKGPPFGDHGGRGSGRDGNLQFQEKRGGRGNKMDRHPVDQRRGEGDNSRRRDDHRREGRGNIGQSDREGGVKGGGEEIRSMRGYRDEGKESSRRDRERDGSSSHQRRRDRSDGDNKKTKRRRTSSMDDNNEPEAHPIERNRVLPNERSNGHGESRSRRDKDRHTSPDKDKRRRHDSESEGEEVDNDRDRRSHRSSRHRHGSKDDDSKRLHRKRSVRDDENSDDEDGSRRHRKRSKDDERRVDKKHSDDSDDEEDRAKRSLKRAKEDQYDIKEDDSVHGKRRHRRRDDDGERDRRRRHEDRDRRHRSDHHRDEESGSKDKRRREKEEQR